MLFHHGFRRASPKKVIQLVALKPKKKDTSGSRCAAATCTVETHMVGVGEVDAAGVEFVIIKLLTGITNCNRFSSCAQSTDHHKTCRTTFHTHTKSPRDHRNIHETQSTRLGHDHNRRREREQSRIVDTCQTDAGNVKREVMGRVARGRVREVE
ncbi:hypothetical protein BD309DRAFT_168415 [Dichomitus squalens]|nr:hypothetical protein BD309DRAFT_168415 [Dichomitus squalens]